MAIFYCWLRGENRSSATKGAGVGLRKETPERLQAHSVDLAFN